jgi:hypothetical protein
LANTTKPRLLFETGLLARTYIPKGDVRLELLSHSKLTTGCPYKVPFLPVLREAIANLTDLGIGKLLRRKFTFWKEG